MGFPFGADFFPHAETMPKSDAVTPLQIIHVKPEHRENEIIRNLLY
jgi:hypothetical protein